MGPLLYSLSVNQSKRTLRKKRNKSPFQMSDEGGVEIDGGGARRRRPPRRDPPPTLPVAFLAPPRLRGIQARERLATARSFHRRFLAHHRKSTILGVFEKYSEELVFSSVLDLP
jgi:hypothetical protein